MSYPVDRQGGSLVKTTRGSRMVLKFERSGRMGMSSSEETLRKNEYAVLK